MSIRYILCSSSQLVGNYLIEFYVQVILKFVSNPSEKSFRWKIIWWNRSRTSFETSSWGTSIPPQYRHCPSRSEAWEYTLFSHWSRCPTTYIWLWFGWLSPRWGPIYHENCMWYCRIRCPRSATSNPVYSCRRSLGRWCYHLYSYLGTNAFRRSKQNGPVQTNFSSRLRLGFWAMGISLRPLQGVYQIVACAWSRKVCEKVII